MTPTHYRKRNIIRSAKGDEKFEFVNEAKRRSREIQLSNGGLGRGAVIVVDKLPTYNKIKEAQSA